MLLWQQILLFQFLVVRLRCPSTTPTSISTTGLVTTLGIGLSGTPDGDEILKLNPASSTSIYDSGDTALS